MDEKISAVGVPRVANSLQSIVFSKMSHLYPALALDWDQRAISNQIC